MRNRRPRYKALADEPNVSASWGNYKISDQLCYNELIMVIEGKTILIIEDDQFLASLLKNRLQRDGFNTVIAKDGEEAVKILKDTKPDLVLLDIILPGKSGFEVLEEIHANAKHKDTPVLIISNLGQEEDIKRGRELGAIEYFVKAKISIDELINKVKSFFAK